MKNILILEDESSIAENIAYALETEGFKTCWCASSQSARLRITEERFDLIIVDIGLPDGNGFEFCSEIRKTSKIPILFLTARADEISRVLGLEMGGDDYVTKPFSPRELTARVKAILRRITNLDPPEYLEKKSKKPPLFEVDDDRFQIRYFGKKLELTRYEFRLLKVFIERPGRVFSRNQLMELAWDEPETSLDRTIDAHIKSLRAKMREILPGFDPIETHRGIGYALKEIE